MASKMADDDHLDFRTKSDKVKSKKDLDNRLREEYINSGLTGVKEYVTKKMNKWKDKKIKIAVTGNSGAGKSSLINALRGIDQSHKNAAKEGVTETTKKSKVYSFPSNENVSLYDIPGAGTTSQPIESYAEKMKFERYDFFVIVTSRRFTENDAVLVKELQQVKRPFFLVRSNIGYDVYNQRKTESRDAVLDTIRKDCLSSLQELGVLGINVFLVDSHVHEDFELGQLQMSIVNNEPREAVKAMLLFSYRNMTKEVIEGKIHHLKDRAIMVALKVVVSSVPGAEYLMKVDVLTDEVNFYKAELVLDDESLEETCDILGFDITEIKNMISFTDLSSQKIITKIFSEADDTLNPAGMCLRFSLEYIGSRLSGFIKSFGKVYNTLCKIIEILHPKALDICELILEQKRQ